MGTYNISGLSPGNKYFDKQSIRNVSFR